MSCLGQRLRAWLILGRVSNLPTVWTNVVAAWVLAGGDLAWSAPFGWLLGGASLLYVGGTTLNDFFDVSFDRAHRQERPIPSGVLSRTAVGGASLAYLVAGALAIHLGAGGSWLYGLGLIAAIVGYDFRHKEWVGAVFVMGACRLFLVLLASSCVRPDLPLGVLLHATSLFVYIVALTLTARGESRPAPSRGAWLSTVLLVVPLGGALGAASSHPHWPVLVAGGVFAALLWRSLRVLKRREDGGRIGKAVGLMLAGIALLDGAFLAVIGWKFALIGLGGFGLARLLQRFVPAT